MQNPQESSKDFPLPRRHALGYMGGLALAMGSSLLTLSALAQAYPNRQCA